MALVGKDIARTMARHRRSGPDSTPSAVRVALTGTLLGAMAGALVVGLVVTVESPERGSTSTQPGRIPAPPPSSRVVDLDPQRYSPVGCQVLAASSTPPRATVFLDAGHGGPDPGAGGTTTTGRPVQEKDLTLTVTLRAADRLRDRGFTVALSRSGDDTVAKLRPGDITSGALTVDGSQAQLVARARCANLARADAAVSIHANSFDDAGVRGAETIYEQHRELGPANRRLATALQANVRSELAGMGRPTPDRGILDDSASGELASSGGNGHLVLLGPRGPGYVDEPTRAPAALIEPLFITNPEDVSAVLSPPGAKALARGITRAVEGFLARQPS